jgi:dolichyl-phosphate beta-glucosyltransferase
MHAEGGITLSVVVPAYNEGRRLAATLATLCEFLVTQPWQWDIVVVDDGSSDDTAAVAKSVAQRERQVTVLREPHRGKGGAVKAGLLRAPGAYRFICDADLSMPVSEIRRFLPPVLTSFDVGIGTREGLAARRIGEPDYRHVMGRIFNYGVQRLALPGIQDSQCGFKMFTAAAVATIFPMVTVDGWAFDVEALRIARERGLRILEVPIEWHYREDSQLHMWRDSFAMLRELLAIAARSAAGKYRK